MRHDTKVHRFISNCEAFQGTSSTESTENPWTPRENLELLRIHRDYHHSSNAKQKAERLHDMMSRIRRTAFEAQKPARTDKEFMSQVRQLKNEGVTVEDLEAELLPPEETPRKKWKGGKK